MRKRFVCVLRRCEQTSTKQSIQNSSRQFRDSVFTSSDTRTCRWHMRRFASHWALLAIFFWEEAFRHRKNVVSRSPRKANAAPRANGDSDRGQCAWRNGGIWQQQSNINAPEIGTSPRCCARVVFGLPALVTFFKNKSEYSVVVTQVHCSFLCDRALLTSVTLDTGRPRPTIGNKEQYFEGCLKPSGTQFALTRSRGTPSSWDHTRLERPLVVCKVYKMVPSRGSSTTTPARLGLEVAVFPNNGRPFPHLLSTD